MKGCLIGFSILTVFGLAVVVGGVGWVRQTIETPPPSPPTIPAHTALRPAFLLRSGKPFAAGTAVAAIPPAGRAPVLLTAYHLFGPAGGLDRVVPAEELDHEILGVVLMPFGSTAPAARARGSLLRTGRAFEGEATTSKAKPPPAGEDLAAFHLLPGAKVNALSLAARNPRFLEWVWLVGDEAEHEPQNQRLFPARVLSASRNAMLLRFHRAFPLKAFSGAPIVNRSGELVGLLLGGEGERQTGVANPVASIRTRLADLKAVGVSAPN